MVPKMVAVRKGNMDVYFGREANADVVSLLEKLTLTISTC